MTFENSASLDWRTAWRLAKRELHARFKGLRLLFVCIFLGTATLVSIGTLTSGIERELASRGQIFLGGDLEVEVWQRDLTTVEVNTLREYGDVSGGTRMQAMASAAGAIAPIQLKAVDHLWPLYGFLTLKDGRKVGAPPEGVAWLSQGAADRLDLQLEDTFKVGTKQLKAGGIILDEPDRLSEGFQLGPSVIVAASFPIEAGLTQPGALYESKYRIRFKENLDPKEVQSEIEKRLTDSAFDFRDRNRSSPGTDRFVRNMSDFLTLVGLAALVISGIGIGGGVSSYLEAKRNSIATLKILGASGQDIIKIYSLQIAAVAFGGSIAGLTLGIFITPLLGLMLQDLLPVTLGLVIDLFPIFLAVGYGLLIAFTFAAAPVLRARAFPVMTLMRARVTPLAPSFKNLLVPALGLLAICLLAIFTTSQPLLAGGFLIAAGGAFISLALIGLCIRNLARISPRSNNPILRAAVSNLHRPGNSTSALITALGFGLSAFVLLAAVQTAIDGNIDTRVPIEAPNYVVLDIPKNSKNDFESLVYDIDPQATVRALPTLRGTILAFGPIDQMTRVSDLEEIPDRAWALRGERGLTYTNDLPVGNSLIEGSWWEKEYAGEPLVSVDAELARAINLEIGDYITIGILGTERDVRVANLRLIDWESMGFNYALVFSRNALEDVPHNLAATVAFNDEMETGQFLRQMVLRFPSSSAIEVKQLLGEARQILDQISVATFITASVAVLAGLAVLIGAVAAARATRTYDTVVLRVLGASQRQILWMQIVEYGLLALLLAFVALAIGSSVAWFIITTLFEFDWLPNWWQVLGVLGTGLLLVIAFSLGGSFTLLKAKPAQSLRTL